MSLILLLAAQAAGQPVTSYSAPTAAQQQAQAQGYSEAQRALSGQQVAFAAPITAPAGTNAILRVGTPVPLRLSEELTTKGKQLRVGNRFHLETSEPVMVNGVTVIPVGSPAVGEITDVRNKGMWGKSGHLAARLLYVTVNGRQIRLSGSFDDKGVTGTAGVVAAVAFVPIAGFFMTGTSAMVPAGSVVKAFIDEDVPLAMPVAPQAPMQVGAPAAPMTVPAQAAAPQVQQRP
jgi:hypothetical protein